jgi:NADH dehydrogenase
MILLCGGTGDLGGRIAQRLHDSGLSYRALVRPGTNPDKLKALGAQVVQGDLTEPASLLAAMDGIETVITTANAISRMLAGHKDVSIEAVDGRGNLNLIEAAERSGVQRFVFISMAGLTEESGRLAPLAARKLAAEKRLTASSMRSVIVRPDKFQEVWLSPATGIDPAHGKARIFGKGQTQEALVAEDDVAALVVAVATEPDPPAVVEFGGKELLTRVEVVDAVDAAFGVTMKRSHVPRAALRIGAAALARPKPEVASLMGMALFSDTHPIRWSAQHLIDRGIAPRTTTAYVQMLAGATARSA